MKSYEYTLKTYSIAYNRTDLVKSVGPHLPNNMLEYLKEDGDAEDCIKTYRRYYGRQGILESDISYRKIYA